MSWLQGVMDPVSDYGVFFSFLLLVIAVIVYWYASMPRGVPPGPLGLPIVGSLPFLKQPLHLEFSALGKKYGSVFSIYLGNQLVIVLNDWKSSKAAFVQQGENFSARPHYIPFYTAPRAQFSIEASEGNHWREHRRFAIQALRDVGFAKTSREPAVLEEIQNFLSIVEEYAVRKEAVDLSDFMVTSLANNISVMTSGKRYSYTDKRIHEIQRLAEGFLNALGYTSPLFCFSWLKVVPGIQKFTNDEFALKMQNDFLDLMDEQIQEHAVNHFPDRNDDFIYSLLTEKENRKRKNGDDKVFSHDALVDVTGNFFIAGTLQPTTLKYALVYMVMIPHIQSKIHQEIDEIVGKNRKPKYEDRYRTPYTEAFLLEVMRHAPIFPINTPHSNFKETTLLGYRIPKRSFVLQNTWNCNHDPKVWGDPEVFRPERFINSEGKCVKPEHFQTFGCGKRICPGETLVRMQMFLYLAALVQRFHFSSSGEISDAVHGSLLYFPSCTKFYVTLRN